MRAHGRRMLCGKAQDRTIEAYTITDGLGHGVFGEMKKCTEKLVRCSWSSGCRTVGFGSHSGRQERQQLTVKNTFVEVPEQKKFGIRKCRSEPILP